MLIFSTSCFKLRSSNQTCENIRGTQGNYYKWPLEVSTKSGGGFLSFGLEAVKIYGVPFLEDAHPFMSDLILQFPPDLNFFLQNVSYEHLFPVMIIFVSPYLSVVTDS